MGQTSHFLQNTKHSYTFSTETDHNVTSLQYQGKDFQINRPSTQPNKQSIQEYTH